MEDRGNQTRIMGSKNFIKGQGGWEEGGGRRVGVGWRKQPLIHPVNSEFSLHLLLSAHSVHLHLHYIQLELIWWRVMDGEVLMLFIETGSGGKQCQLFARWRAQSDTICFAR